MLSQGKYIWFVCKEWNKCSNKRLNLQKDPEKARRGDAKHWPLHIDLSILSTHQFLHWAFLFWSWNCHGKRCMSLCLGLSPSPLWHSHSLQNCRRDNWNIYPTLASLSLAEAWTISVFPSCKIRKILGLPVPMPSLICRWRVGVTVSQSHVHHSLEAIKMGWSMRWFSEPLSNLTNCKQDAPIWSLISTRDFGGVWEAK